MPEFRLPTLEHDFLQAVLENLQAGVVVCDADGVLVLFNDAARRLHGLSEQPLLPHQWAQHYDLYRPDGKTLMSEPDIPLGRALRGETVENVEMVIAPRQLPARTLLASGRQIFATSGQVLGAIVVMHDITDRKQMEIALRQSEARLSSIFATIPDGVAIIDTQGQLVSANAAAEKILRLTQSDLVGRSYNDPAWSISTLDGEDFPVAELPFAQVIRSGQPVYGIEHAIAHPDGTRTFLSVSASPLFDGEGQIIHVVTAISDITSRIEAAAKRQQTEQALRRSEQLYRSLIETAAEGIVLQQADGTISTCNANAERILGLTADQMMGRSSHDPRWRAVREDGSPFPGVDHPAMVTLRSGEPQSNVVMGIHKPDGSLTWVSINTRPLYQNGDRPSSVVVTFFEVTERIRAEAERQQAEAERLQRLQAQSARAVAEAKQEQATFLAEVSGALASSLDYEQTLQKAANLAVPYFADWCSIDLLTPDGSISRMAIAHRDPDQVEQAWALSHRFPRQLEQGFGVGQVIRSGQPEIVPEVTDEMLAATLPDAEQLEAVRQYHIKSCILAPLQTQDRVLGCISFVFAESDRRYGSSDLTLASDLAQRVAIAIDNARLFAAAQQSRQAAEAAAERTARLQMVTAALSEVLSPQQVADVIAEQSLAALGADTALVALLTPDRQALEIVKVEGCQLDLVEGWQRFSVEAQMPLAEAVRTGQPVWLGSPEERWQRYPHLIDYYNRYDFKGWLSLPLRVEGRAVGGMSLSFKTWKPLSQADRDFILALSSQCAQAILRAQLYEAERQARTEAERANRVKDEFLAILSHELRSPLNPILGWSRLLQTHALTPERTQTALATIERNAKLQTQLIDDLLDVARILRGKLRLEKAPISLASTVESAIETVKAMAAAKSISLHPDLESVGQVYADAGRLQQIVWNLLSNAIKFTPSGGRVEVRLEKVSGEQASWAAPTPSSPTSARLTVTDTGKGIDPDFLPYLFQSFRQEDTSITRQHGGLGLGLSIVKYLVDAHGGTVAADSPGEGQGAVFTVELPLTATPKPSPAADEDADQLNLSGLSILAVDDDPDTRDLLTVILAEYGAEVRTIATAAEALTALAVIQPDVLISDIGMPGMNGFTFIQQVRSRPPGEGGQTPAIALTAYTREADQQRALTSGYQQHLSKPLDVETLIRAVKTVVAQAAGHQ